jgi:hypothetical protein
MVCRGPDFVLGAHQPRGSAYSWAAAANPAMAPNFPRVSWRCDRDCNRRHRGPVFNRRGTAIVETGLGRFRSWMWPLCFVILTLYGGLKPKGDVYATPEGQAWVQLRDVHSNFANAVEAMEH